MNSNVFKVTVIALLPVMIGCSSAERIADVETWRCGLLSDRVDVTLTADHDAGTGTINTDGLPIIETEFDVVALKRTWVWIDDRSVTGSVFVIGSSGNGLEPPSFKGAMGTYRISESGEPEDEAEEVVVYATCERAD